jgi:chemotaxis protein CheD
VVWSSAPLALSTILGSCVAVCLWDRQARVGGMNHYLLPSCPAGGRPSPRFGTVAVPELVRGLYGLGATADRLAAWVFGGAQLIGAFPAGHDHLGTRNIEAAEELLGREGIAVVGGDVGGRRGRRVVFDTGDGQALVRLL